MSGLWSLPAANLEATRSVYLIRSLVFLPFNIFFNLHYKYSPALVIAETPLFPCMCVCPLRPCGEEEEPWKSSEVTCFCHRILSSTEIGGNDNVARGTVSFRQYKHTHTYLFIDYACHFVPAANCCTVWFGVGYCTQDGCWRIEKNGHHKKKGPLSVFWLTISFLFLVLSRFLAPPHRLRWDHDGLREGQVLIPCPSPCHCLSWPFPISVSKCHSALGARWAGNHCCLGR